ncbi:hypothetical protein BP5796_12339 [Coleophoma crateriformis]|uniref:NB-ARC domain-containing protein n=1 Tax=Coleophoma crateriformis TaxID=565419 RepID=A0A3D8Q9D5_9HELO|nr:hypothetical protein BP5796_12339 [Coleophoma crateriformis]
MPLRQLFPDPDPAALSVAAKVDIIAVHGLNPRSKNEADHAWDTWRTPAGKTGHLWLRDDLPSHLSESRILLYQYDSTAVYGQDRGTFIDKANALLEAIRIERDDVGSRPILFLGHSMGGLLIKQALINAHNNPKYTPIKDATSGLAFFATPHFGGQWTLVKLGGLVADIAKTMGFKKGDNVLETLKEGSIFSDIIQEHWRHQLLNYDIISFWGDLDSVVSKDSVQFGLPGQNENVVKLNADHHGVCKFGQGQKDQDNFKLVRGNLRDLYKRALEKYTNEQPKPDDSPIPWLVPYNQNPYFTGRNNILEQLHLRLNDLERHPFVAIYGLGGSGKSAIAIEFAHQVRDGNSSYAIFWVSAFSTKRLAESFRDIAKVLQIPGADDQTQDMLDPVRRKLSGENQGRWLMIIDNVDDENVLYAKDATRGNKRMYDYLPRSRRGMILCTTRTKKIAVKLAPGDFLSLPQMDATEARQLLTNSLKGQEDIEQGQLIQDLLQSLTWLPLAIVQAVAFMNENGTSVSRYLEILRETDRSLINTLNEHFEDSTRDRDSQNAVVATWLISFQQIEKDDKLAAQYLSFLACIAPQDIPRSIFPPAESDMEQEKAIGTLTGYSFLTPHTKSGQYNMHILIHQVTRTWLQSNGRWHHCVQQTTRRLTELIPWGGHERHREYVLYLSHGSYAANITDIEDIQTAEAIELLDQVGWCYAWLGDYKTAEGIFRTVLDRRKEKFGLKHRQTLVTMNELGLVLNDQGKYEEAAKLHRETEMLNEDLFGPEDPETLTSQANLAATYRNQGRWNDAEKLEVQVMETRERANLAATYWNQGRWNDAEKLGVQVMETSLRVLGAEHPDTLRSQANLATTFRSQDRLKQAEDLFVKVVEGSKNVLGPEHPDTLNRIGNLAFNFKMQDRIADAIHLMESCAQLSVKVLGHEHFLTKDRLQSLESWQHSQSSTAGNSSSTQESGPFIAEVPAQVENEIQREASSNSASLTGEARQPTGRTTGLISDERIKKSIKQRLKAMIPNRSRKP